MAKIFSKNISLRLNISIALSHQIKKKSYAFGNPVPEFGLPHVLEIDWTQVQVLYVPGEHGPEISKIDVGCVDSVQFHIIQTIVQARIQSLQIPFRFKFLFEERAFDVASIQWGLEMQIFPEKLFHF